MADKIHIISISFAIAAEIRLTAESLKDLAVLSVSSIYTEINTNIMLKTVNIHINTIDAVNPPFMPIPNSSEIADDI